MGCSIPSQNGPHVSVGNLHLGPVSLGCFRPRHIYMFRGSANLPYALKQNASRPNPVLHPSYPSHRTGHPARQRTPKQGSRVTHSICPPAVFLEISIILFKQPLPPWPSPSFPSSLCLSPASHWSKRRDPDGCLRFLGLECKAEFKPKPKHGKQNFVSLQDLFCLDWSVLFCFVFS